MIATIPEMVEVEDATVSSIDPACRGKSMITAVFFVAVVAVIAVAATLASQSKNAISFVAMNIDAAKNNNDANVVPNESIESEDNNDEHASVQSIYAQKSSDGNGVVKPQNNFTTSIESNTAIENKVNGNISDIMLANQQLLRQRQSFNVHNCPSGEKLWNLLLATDDYPWETKWALYKISDNDAVLLASGPPKNSNYSPRTRYTGNLCLGAGQYYMKWYDRMGDGLCCKYGPGEWAVRLSGEVILQNDPMDSSYTERDFPFEVESSSTSVEMTGIFLIMPRPYDPVMNVEFDDGTIYELLNLPVGFNYADRGLVSGISSLSLLIGIKMFPNGTVDMSGKAPLTSRRRLVGEEEIGREDTVSSSKPRRSNRRLVGKFSGNKSVLAVRVIAEDGTTNTFDETSLSNSIHGNGVDRANLASQFKACSYGKLNSVKAPSKSGRSNSNGVAKIVNGVITIRLPSIRISEGHGTMRNAITKELNDIFKVTSPSQLSDYVIYCLPPDTPIYSPFGGSGIGYAYINSWLTIFHDKWCTSMSLQMHELGHLLNMGHSNEDGVAYEDQSGIMGASYPNNDGPKLCFNAAKSWQTGWYKDKSIAINSSGASKCFDGTVHGIAQYAAATTVLLKVKDVGSDVDYYINFNAQRGINIGTQEAGNQVTVVSRPRGIRDSYAESQLVAKLDSGMSYSTLEYTISVGRVDAKAGMAEVRVLSASGQDGCV